MGRGIDFVSERARMVDRLVRSGYIKDPTVRAAFLAVPREAFVRPEDRAAAYHDVPESILFGLALRELAGSLPKVSNLVLTPDLITPLLTRFGVVPGAPTPRRQAVSGKRS